MKKKPKNKVKIALWLVFVAGCLWVILVPPRPLAPSVTVKVQHPAPIEKPAELQPQEQSPTAGGEETAPTPPQATVTIPVMPEKLENLPPGTHPKIAIVIDDVGVDLKGSEKAIALPAPITLSFLPYATRLREQTSDARRAGHELILHMPMEPLGHEDPGPGALLVDLPMRDLQGRFETALASFTGFDGVNNHMGSKFTAYADGMNMVMDELSQRHLFFFDSKTSAQSIGLKIAQEKNLPTISRDVFLDDDQSPAIIRKQLEATEHIARHKGYAVAIGHPHAATMEVLPVWIKEAQARGFVLVPLHDLVKGE
jgi:polysaccharide deacetylase 2 family uncharacterized protein YibQ